MRAINFFFVVSLISVSQPSNAAPQIDASSLESGATYLNFTDAEISSPVTDFSAMKTQNRTSDEHQDGSVTEISSGFTELSTPGIESNSSFENTTVLIVEGGSPEIEKGPAEHTGLAVSLNDTDDEARVMVVVSLEHIEAETDSPLLCSASPLPAIVRVGAPVALTASLAALPRPCMWLFLAENNATAVPELNASSADANSDLYAAEVRHGTEVEMKRKVSKNLRLTCEDLILVGNYEWESDSDDGGSIQKRDVEKNVNHDEDDEKYEISTEVSNKQNNDQERNENIEKNNTNIHGNIEKRSLGENVLPNDVTTQAVTESSQQGDETHSERKCAKGNHMIVGDTMERSERVCGFVQDFEFTSHTGALTVRLRARGPGTDLGDFEMAGCTVSLLAD
ncbi:uncharacterized protein LOC108681568 [Hyalella azteca]|uniref:Uncharacterized protein LOC108681568 n=1 Tax=Hyalella azteca TaxID=294128 RepID=A0A8B7PL05_HYAAZ|nr:uncharacterized protein LOC108681568 [Hyalella azteca]